MQLARLTILSERTGRFPLYLAYPEPYSLGMSNASKATFHRLINLSLAPMHPAAPVAQRILDIYATKGTTLTFSHFLELCGPNVHSMLFSIAHCPDPGLPGNK